MKFFVIPAQAGIQCFHDGRRKRTLWIPAFTGMTSKRCLKLA